VIQQPHGDRAAGGFGDGGHAPIMPPGGAWAG
jgi:hypothetical protein